MDWHPLVDVPFPANILQTRPCEGQTDLRRQFSLEQLLPAYITPLIGSVLSHSYGISWSCHRHNTNAVADLTLCYCLFTAIRKFYIAWSLKRKLHFFFLCILQRVLISLSHTSKPRTLEMKITNDLLTSFEWEVSWSTKHGLGACIKSAMNYN